MIALVGFLLTFGVFASGYIFAFHGFWASMMFGFFALCMGLLIAAAETRGFQGQHVHMKNAPYRWEALFLDVVRFAIDQGKVAGTEPVYVQTNEGVVPITGLFSARVNAERAIIFDLTPPHEETEAQYSPDPFLGGL